MYRVYDALLKARREKRVHKKGPIASEPKPKAEDSANQDGSTHEILPLGSEPKIKPRRSKMRSAVDHGSVMRRVSVGDFIEKPNSLLGEQFRKLRNAITTHNLVDSLHSVLITSCMPGEGKTTVSLNLSATVARGLDDSVVLVDADLRRLNLTSLLGLRDAPGLLDILEGKATIEETLVATEIEGMTIIPGGTQSANCAELIASIRMRGFVRKLEERYKNSYIFIDSTPIVSTSEANILSHMVDGIIVVILADKTRRDVVKMELKSINSAKILGVVLNCAEFETSRYHHKYYKDYSRRKKD
jgi:capsular exopolysaccharide synthesis family protein